MNLNRSNIMFLAVGVALTMSLISAGAQAQSRRPVTDAELKALDGAKYVKRSNFTSGFNVDTFVIDASGPAIKSILYDSRLSGETVRVYPIKHGTFYKPFESWDVCYKLFSTRDCGWRGTITPEAIFWTVVADGKPTADQKLRGESSPIYRQK